MQRKRVTLQSLYLSLNGVWSQKEKKRLNWIEEWLKNKRFEAWGNPITTINLYHNKNATLRSLKIIRSFWRQASRLLKDCLYVCVFLHWISLLKALKLLQISMQYKQVFESKTIFFKLRNNEWKKNLFSVTG